MSITTTAERLRRRLQDGESGFTLIEVMVAMVVFALVSTAAAAMVAGGTKAAMVTRMDTGAKELGQQQLESMRNLLHQPDGGSDSSAVELLKKYFPVSSTTSVGCGVTGFVLSTSARCTSDGDPSSGDFYRTVISPVSGFSKYKQYITVSFLNDTRQAISVGTGYSPSSPPSGFISITVQTFWKVGTLSKKFLLGAYLPSMSPAAPEATLAGHAVALELDGNLDSTRTASIGAGIADLSGAITLGATATAAAEGGYAAISGGSRIDGGQKVSAVPPSDSGAPYSGPTSATPISLTDNGVTVASLNNPSYSGVGAWTTSALPTLGSSSLPVKGYVPKQGSGQRDLTFNNDSSPDARLALAGSTLVWVTQGASGDPVPSASSTANSVSGQGYGGMTATSGATRHQVSVTMSASTQTIHLLPTSFAPDGLVQIRLSSGSLTCQTNGQSAVSPAATYTAYVSFWEDRTRSNWQYEEGSWQLASPASAAGYVPYLTLTNAQGNDPLRDAPLSQIQVGTDSSGAPLYLSDYIASWQSLTSSEAAGVGQVDATTKTVQATVSSVLGLSTTPMRSGDADSGVSLTLGNLSCSAEDDRS